MKKLLLLALVLFASTAQAQTADDMVPACLPAPCASILNDIIANVAVATPIDNGDFLSWRNAADNANLGVLAVDSSDHLVMVTGTADAADTSQVQISGGGAFTSTGTRGAGVNLAGNEESGGVAGLAQIIGGNVATGHIDLRALNASAAVRFFHNSLLRWSVGSTGALTSDATNGGDLIFAGSGDTISIQEATAATACMGVATPNGNTPVAVTTSCATSGAKVFYTRQGAVTNMGTITTTTPPSGTGFSFASTGASDTLASSVIYLIVKESA